MLPSPVRIKVATCASSPHRSQNTRMTTTTASGANSNAGSEATMGINVLANFAFMFITNQVIKYFNLEDPAYLLYVRVGFAVTHALSLISLIALKMRIQKTAPIGGAVEVVEPSMLPGQPTPIKRILTFCEYDLHELSTQTKFVAVVTLLSSGFHYFFKSNGVLIVSIVNVSRAQLAFPLFKFYFFGQKAEGSLQRPFKASSSPIGGLFAQSVQSHQQPNTTTKNDDSSPESVKSAKFNGSRKSGNVRQRKN